MPYPAASADQVAFFNEHGWLALEDAIDPVDLASLEQKCAHIIANKETMAFDWAWRVGERADERQFRILQASPTLHWPEFNAARFRLWAIEFAAALMGRPLEFWYDQFLAKPPHIGAATQWHQDEAYWGRNLDGQGITCWMPMHCP